MTKKITDNTKVESKKDSKVKAKTGSVQAKSEAKAEEKKIQVKAERKVKSDGLVAKKAFAAECAKKGMTRPQTIAALMEKFPGMAANYARTMCYSYLKEDGVLFQEAKRGKTPVKKEETEKGSKKKESNSEKKTSAKADSNKSVTKATPKKKTSATAGIDF